MTENHSCSYGADELKNDHLSLRRSGQCRTTDHPCSSSADFKKGQGNIACTALPAVGTENLLANAMNADEVIVLDACQMLCAKKIAIAQGIQA